MDVKKSFIHLKAITTQIESMKGEEMINIKRAYEKPSKEDGYRVLVDRLWPRGLKKEAAKIDLWSKEVAPSDQLRQWFGHEEVKWGEFKKRYFRELDSHQLDIAEFLSKASQKNVTLLYAAKDTNYNNAAALLEYIKKHSLKAGSFENQNVHSYS